MSISNEIQKLQTNLANSYEACNDKGATMPASQNFDNLADCIGSITSGSGVDKYLVSNVTKVGAIEDDKGILSGFSTTDYVKLPFNIPTSSASSWEVVIPFHYSRAGDESQILLGYPEAGSNRYKSPQIDLVADERIELCLSSNGTSWDIVQPIRSNNVMELNKDYIVKLSFSGTEYKLEVSRDGYNFTTWISAQSSTKMYGFYNTSLGTGGGTSAILPTNGSINLNGCSIKVDNETVWQGVVNSQSDSGEKLKHTVVVEEKINPVNVQIEVNEGE